MNFKRIIQSFFIFCIAIFAIHPSAHAQCWGIAGSCNALCINRLCFDCGSGYTCSGTCLSGSGTCYKLTWGNIDQYMDSLEGCNRCMDEGYGSCGTTGVSSIQACTWYAVAPTNTPTPTPSPTPIRPTPPLTGDFTFSGNVLFPKIVDGNNASRYVVGLDDGTQDTVNESTLTMSGGTLTINADETFAVGSIQLNSGSLIVANGASIRIGTPIWVEDVDGDAVMDSDKAYVVPAGPSGAIRRKYIPNLSVDCNNSNASYNYTTTGNPPIAHWRFDDATTATNKDNAGALNGISTGTTVVDLGRFGKARSFNGTSDFITIPNAYPLNFSTASAFTIEAWVKPNSIGAIQKVFSKIFHSGVYTGYDFDIMATGGARLLLVSTTLSQPQNRLDAVTTTPLQAGQWTHIAASYNGNLSFHGIRMYINGATASATPQYNSLTGDIRTSAPPRIGTRYGSTLFMNGSIDDVRIYDYVRNYEQVQEDIKNYAPVIPQYDGDTDGDGYGGTGAATNNCMPLTGYGPKNNDCSTSDATYGIVATGNPPIAYWKMDEASGTTVKDSLGAHHGIALGTSVATGIYGNSRNLSGTKNYIMVAKNESDFDFSSANSFSISGWINTGNSVASVIVSKSKNFVPYNGWQLSINGNELGFDFANAWTSDWIRITGNHFGFATDKNWHHIEFVYAGSAASANTQFYLDGKILPKAIPYNSISATVLNDEPVRIGYNNDKNNNPFGGQLDEFKIYNYARTATQVAEDYSNAPHAYTQYSGDTDGDGYSSTSSSVSSCAPVANYGVRTGDCDDTRTGSGTYTTAITGNAPVASWSFNETSGSIGKDDIRSQNAYQSGTTIVDGMYGKARSFNGTTDYMWTSSVIDALPVTISSWVYLPATPSGWTRILRSDVNPNTNYTGVMLSVQATGAADIAYGDNTGAGPTNRRSLTSSTGIPIGQWTHVAATINGPTDMHIYINGAEAGGTYSGTGGAAMASPGFYGVIGAWLYDGTGSFPGYIDSLRVYNYIRSRTQIMEDMLNSFPTLTQYQTDADNDGFASTSNSISTCYPVAGYGYDYNDCNDADWSQRKLLSGNAPVAYWKLNEPYNTNSVDITSGNVLTPYNTSVWQGVSGKMMYMTSREFNGTSAYMEAPNHSTLQRSGNWSMAAWIFPTNITDQRLIIVKNSEYIMRIDTPAEGNKISCFMYVNGAWQTRASSVAIPTLNKWTHVECTYDGSVLRMYINGGTPTTSNFSGSSVATTNNLFLGRWSGGGSFFYGYIDDVRLYNYARSAAQVIEDREMYFPSIPGYTDNDSDSYGTGSVSTSCGVYRSYNNTDGNDSDGSTQLSCVSAGGACTDDSQCCASAQYCGLDADNDNYFIANHPGGSTCTATNKPHTDCYDGNANAKPGQTSCFGNHRGDYSYDYNCDGNGIKCGLESSGYTTANGLAWRQCLSNVCWTDPQNTYFTGYDCSGTSSCGGTGYSCTGSKPTSCSGACSFSGYRNTGVDSGTVSCK